jgi:hypothetical protein
MVAIDDRIQVDSKKVGVPRRTGVVVGHRPETRRRRGRLRSLRPAPRRGASAVHGGRSSLSVALSTLTRSRLCPVAVSA